MKCTVCQRELAPNLSMCVRCGAMKDDSVREEIESTLTPLATPVRFHFIEERADAVPRPAVSEPIPVVSDPKPLVCEAKPVVRRSHTADLGIKKTSPTLAEFVSPRATVPDWRLQLQNSVRRRSTGRERTNGTADAVSVSSQPNPAPTSGANALKVQYDDAATANETDRRVSNALKRIEQSRRAYLPTEKAREGIRVAKAAARKFPFNVVSRSEELPDRPAAEPIMTVRPRLVSSLKIEKKEYDTNKLVPIPEAARMASSFSEAEEEPKAKAGLKENWSQKIEIRENATEAESKPQLPLVEETEPETEEIDDLAPISMRFNAGLFDLIIGGFASFVLLSPFLAFSEGWFALSGILLFTSVLLVVMFLYLTAAISYLGQTFGMKIFSLELVDVELSEYPTIHQAAVSSSVYLLSLILGGLGFVPILFNEEKRAAHDLVSGTILIREI